MEQWIIMVGNIVDGVYFVGPFDDHEEATEFGEKEYGHDDWLVAPIVSKEDALEPVPVPITDSSGDVFEDLGLARPATDAARLTRP